MAAAASLLPEKETSGTMFGKLAATARYNLRLPTRPEAARPRTLNCVLHAVRVLIWLGVFVGRLFTAQVMHGDDTEAALARAFCAYEVDDLAGAAEAVGTIPDGRALGVMSEWLVRLPPAPLPAALVSLAPLPPMPSWWACRCI